MTQQEIAIKKRKLARAAADYIRANGGQAAIEANIFCRGCAACFKLIVDPKEFEEHFCSRCGKCISEEPKVNGCACLAN